MVDATTTLSLKYSNVVGKVPLATDLVLGEPALNLADRILHTKDMNGEIIEIGVPKSHVGSGGFAHAVSSVTAAGFMSSADKAKLDGIADGANLYVLPIATASALGGVKQGSNVTIGADGVISVAAPLSLATVSPLADGTASVGTSTKAAKEDHVHPLQTTVSGNAGTATKLATARNINGISFDGSANITINAVDSTARIASTEKGAANGVCPLGADSKVAASYLPSYVDDVVEAANLAGLPAAGETGKIYVTLDTNKTYRWSGTAYIEISPTAGTSDSATKLATPRTIALSGDVSGSASFDGSANITIAAAIQPDSVALGTDTTGNYVAAVAVPASGLTVSAAGEGVTQTLALANDLAAVEGLASTGIVRRTAADTWSAGTGISTAEITNSAVTYAKVQNVSATDKLLGRATTGAGVIEEIVCTAAGRALLDDTSAAAQRTTLGLGTMATQDSSNVAITGGTITGVTLYGGTY